MLMKPSCVFPEREADHISLQLGTRSFNLNYTLQRANAVTTQESFGVVRDTDCTIYYGRLRLAQFGADWD